MNSEWIRTLVGQDLTTRHFGWLTLAAALALSLIGVYAIDVATNLKADPDGITASGRVLKQLVFLSIGMGAAAFAALPHYRFIRYAAWPVALIVLGLLIFLLIPFVPTWLVTPRNGARGWINLGVMDFQPAEVAKIAFVLVVAGYLRYRSTHRRFLGLVPLGVITFVPVALITLQPDLGTAMLFVPAIFAMLVAAGAKMKHLTVIVLIGALAGPAAYPLLKPHQKARIQGLLHMIEGSREGADGINFQSYTALTLAGAGGLDGQGDARSRALVHFNELPERHNDMVFAVIINRFGFLGGLGVLLLYLVYCVSALLTAALCKDPFGRLIAVGFTAIIAAQVFVNVGMNLGILPIIGITLPFVSYGGSSMLTVWMMTGLIVNVAMRRPPRLSRPSFEFD